MLHIGNSSIVKSDRASGSGEANRQLKLNADTVERIRSELIEDRYHDQLSESEYWDETHNWGAATESVSDDYWHFLGRYE